MATEVTSVTASINGVETTLTLNSETGLWEGTATAPTTSSFLLGGYYNVSLTATKASGTTATVDADDFDELKLKVYETTAPTIYIVSPNTDAYLTNSTVGISFGFSDNDSGINTSTISVKLDGTEVDYEYSDGDDKTGANYTAAVQGVTDGTHTLVVSVSDNDGNTAEKSVTFVVDTVAPSLDITSPAEGLITAEAEVTVSGTTSETTSVPVTVTVAVNGGEAAEVTVNNDGSFTTTVTLEDGENTITITATDFAGQSTTVTRTITCDSSLPTFVSVVIKDNPAAVGSTITLTVEVY